jgi:succinylglutamate desuccinylase
MKKIFLFSIVLLSIQFGFGNFTHLKGYSALASQYNGNNPSLTRAEQSRLDILSDSGIFGPKYSDIEKELIALATQYPRYAERFIYGKSVKGKNLNVLKVYDKEALTILPPGSLPAILIAGSIHGNEYLNIEDRLPRWFLEQGIQDPSIKKYLSIGGVIYFAPILNPDGYVSRKRENARRKDLNRDFSVRYVHHLGFKQPETASLAKFLDQEIKKQQLKLKMTMDYHCCLGAVLYPWSFEAPPIPALDYDRYQRVGTIIKTAFNNDLQFGTTPVLLGYEAVGTSKDYYYEKYGTYSFTFEGKFKKEDKRFNLHQEMWKRLVELVVSTTEVDRSFLP